ncbi:hypothetical protein [Bordetella petrii]|uniref:hypothetical protein n=1 Tax=Bordetella petrii TaxID=94624 RepID=UPI00048DFCF9|nr:hypothetical protein [Bordetella petrii]
MALDDAFQEGIDTALRNRATLAPIAPAEESGFSLWGLTKAPFTGVAAGATEAAGFWSDMVGAFGSVSAAYGTTGVLPFAETEEQREWRQQGAAAARQQVETGESFSSEAGDRLRDAARWLGPDQKTASTAENIVFGLTKTVTKAVGYSVATGNPITAAALTGVDEGAAAADELRQQGVDFATRTQAGAITALATGVGVGLPVAGRTVAGTLGLAAGGGPGLFIAQQQMTRDILNRADYGKLADQYDPFDPVGLAVSFLAPAAFGGLALRARTRAAGRAEAAPAGSDQPAMATRADLEVEDAARVQAVREVVDSWNLADPADVRAANDALMSVMRASGQLADGLPVSIPERFPMRAAYAARALDRLIERAETSRAELLPQAGMVAEPGAIRAMRAEIDQLTPTRARAQDQAAIQARAKEIQASTPRTSYKQALARARQEAADQAGEAEARIAALEEQIDANADAVDARRALAVLDAQIERMKADRAAIDAPATELAPLTAALREAGIGGRQPMPGGRAAASRPSEGGTPAARVPPEAGPVAVTPAAARADIDPLVPPAKLQPGTAQATSQAHVAARIAELEANQPDALVRLEGDTEEIPVTEALRRLNDELARADADADLLAVAANCAVSAL